MATAPNTKSAPVAATGKNGAPIRVVTPDQDGNFYLKIAKGDVEKVQVVDVDMVLNLKDGSKLVLAGGALSAMDGNDYVDFSDGKDSASHLLELVGKIELQKFDDSRVLNSEPVNDAPHGGTNDGDANALGQLLNQSQSGNAELSNAINKALGSLEHVVQNNSSSINEFQTDYDAYAQPPNKQLEVTIQERPGKTPVEHQVGPSEPTLFISLLNTTGTTQVGNVLYGAGGSPASATDPRNSTQFAAQVINAPDSATVIHATGDIPANTFVKVASVELAGSGATVQSVLVTGVPAGVQILNATDLGNGTYSMQGVPGQSTYNFQLLYSTAIADASSPIHPPQFSLTFTVEYSTNLGLGNLIQVTPFVIKDASSASDLTYIDATTGATVFVLPAQGVPHEIHAGNNAGTTIYGSNSNDLLYGGTGNDTLNGGTGSTYFEGGVGADTIVGGNNGVQIGTTGVFGTNVNTIGYTGSATGVTVNMSASSAVVDGVTIAGQSGKGSDAEGDTWTNIKNVIGSAHNDTFVVGDKSGNYNGGGHDVGGDTLNFSKSANAVTVDLINGTATGAHTGGDTFTNIQNVTGSAQNDTFIANSDVNKFDGGGTSADVNGNVIGDTVSYAASAAVIVNLSASTANGVAALSGSGGYAQGDTYVNIQNVIGSSGNDLFIAGSAANRFSGGDGSDTVSYASSAAGVLVNFANNQGSDAVAGQASDAAGDRYVSIENVVGSQYDDIFIAGVDSKNFNGGAGGNDTVSYVASGAGVVIDTFSAIQTGSGIKNINGVADSNSYANGNSYVGIEKFIGSAYDDTFIGGAAVNQYDGGFSGFDTVDYSHSTAAVKVDLFNNIGTGGLADGDTYAHIQNAIGGSGDDLFVANQEKNTFNGGLGSNTVSYEEATDGHGVNVDMATGDISGVNDTSYAKGDKFINIQNIIGTTYDDTFVASSANNSFSGHGGSDTVSYISSNAGVIVNLSGSTQGGVTSQHGSGGYANGDTYDAINNIIGSNFNDTFYANGLVNTFDGVDNVSSTSHNRVSYAGSNNTDLIINLSNAVAVVGATTVAANTGSGGDAQDDKYLNIQDATGAGGNDTFIASSAANDFKGGNGSDTVSYVNSTAAVTVNFVTNQGSGTGTSYAIGDTYNSIENVIGSQYDDTFVVAAVSGKYDGGVSAAGAHNRVDFGSITGPVTVDLSANTGSAGTANYTFANIQDATGGNGADTFVASSAANDFKGGGGSDTVSYVNSTAAVTVNFVTNQGSGTGTSYAIGDTYNSIENVIGSQYDDTFVVAAVSGKYDGGVSAAGAHNLADFSSITGPVTVDLFNNVGSVGSVNYTFANIQDVKGTTADDTFIASADANFFDGGTSTGTSHNRVSYANDTVGVTVDLSTAGALGVGGLAAGDKYTNIQDVTGGSGADTFVASSAANDFKGGGGSDTVSYVNSTAAVTVNFVTNQGSGTGTSYAIGDTYNSIENVIGSQYDDTFVVAAVSGKYDGGVSAAGAHNLADFSSITGPVTVDLFNNVGSVGSVNYTFANIQDVKGTTADDTFIASADANFFDGGTSTGTSHNRVSYANDTVGVTVDLSTAGALGVGGLAAGDKYTNIQDVTGGSGADTFIASSAANDFKGGNGSDTVSYVNSTAAVTVNFVTNQGSGTGTSYAIGDTYNSIENVIGSQYDDTFVVAAVSGKYDGGVSAAGAHNLADFSSITGPVTVDLFNNVGSVGSVNYTFANIQDVKGTTADDTFIASADANFFDGGTSTGTSHNRVSYANDTVGVTVDLSTAGALGVGGLAAGDKYTNIQDVTGGSGADTFVASSAANDFKGGGGSDTVSYVNSTAAVTVNFVTNQGSGTGTSYAIGDTYNSIENVIGSQYDDTFVVAAVSGKYDGGVSAAGAHNLADFSSITGPVTVDLFNNVGSVGSVNYTFANIQDVKGTTADDTFIASADANFFDGGTSTGTSHNRVSYANDTVGVTVDLSTAGALGVGGLAAGDKYTNIQDVTGGSGADTFVASSAANDFKGGGGSDTVSYVNSTAAVTVNFVTNQGSGTGTSYAIGDTYNSIENVIGSQYDDTFVVAAVSGKYDGGVSAAGAHNRVDFGSITGPVTVDLFANTGSAGTANYTFANIQDATGGNGADTFVASSAANDFKGGGGSDTVSYMNSTAAVTVNFVTNQGSGTGTSYAIGDTYNSIENVIGSQYDDTFVVAAVSGKYDGGVSAAGAHNRVDFGSITGPVTVDLFANTGSAGTANYTFANIQDATGGNGADTFVASSAANDFKGGGGSDTVSYVNSTAAVTVNFVTNQGSGTGTSYAIGDTYNSIENVIGSQYDDTFVVAAVNGKYDGGTSTTGSHNLIDFSSITGPVTVDLVNNTGSTASNNYTFANIQDVKGTTGSDLFIGNNAANFFDGGASGSDTVSYSSATGSGVTASLQTGTGTAGFASGDTYTRITNLIGSTFTDTLTGLAAGGSTLTGLGGGDTLTGIGLNNTASYAGSAAVQVDLFYTNGTNTSGGDANGDKLSGIQNLIGSANNDVFYANGVANIFNGNGSLAAQGSDLVFTGAGGDTVNYSHSDSAVTVNLNTNTASGGFADGDSFIGIANLVGSAFNDTLTGLAAGGSTLTGGVGADTLNGLGTNNTISYIGSAAVNVDLYTGSGTIANTGGDAAGDIISNIQNIIGSANNDLFYASADANKFTGGGGVDTVSYFHAGAGVTVDLNAGSGSGSAFATGDTYVNIQNAIGSGFNDTFVASNLANAFDGGTGGIDTVSYTASTASVTVDLFHGTGANGYAVNDTYTHIQNAIGSGSDDIFVGNSLANAFNGGNGTDTVSYQYSTTTAIVASLATNTGTGGDANGDTYTSIENLTGSENVNSTLTGNTAANVLTALGLNTTNVLVGGGGNDTFDGVAGLHNTMTGGTGNDLFKITATGSTSNVTQITGGGGTDTLEVHGSAASLNASAFSGVVSGGINTLDLSKGAYNVVQFSYDDVHGLGGGATLNLRLNNGEGLDIVKGTSDHYVFFSGTNDYAFYNAANVEIGRLHLLATVP